MSNTCFILLVFIPILTAINLRRIIGGEYAVIEEFPYLGLLTGKCGNQSHWMCGSSILNQRILLTAAHCLQNCRLYRKARKDRVEVFFGGTEMSRMADMRIVKQITIHPGWDEISAIHDIAVVIVRKDINFGDRIKRVIIKEEFPPVNQFFEVFVAGWGTYNNDLQNDPNVHEDHLRKTYQKLRSPESCARYGRMSEGIFCAGRMQKEGDHPSGGDSGSPLVTRNRKHQIGLVSFGWVLYPAMTVYTNVSYYHQWIADSAKRLYCNDKYSQNFRALHGPQENPN